MTWQGDFCQSCGSSSGYRGRWIFPRPHSSSWIFWVFFDKKNDLVPAFTDGNPVIHERDRGTGPVKLATLWWLRQSEDCLKTLFAVYDFRLGEIGSIVSSKNGDLILFRYRCHHYGFVDSFWEIRNMFFRLKVPLVGFLGEENLMAREARSIVFHLDVQVFIFDSVHTN